MERASDIEFLRNVSGMEERTMKQKGNAPAFATFNTGSFIAALPGPTHGRGRGRGRSVHV